MIKSTFLTTLLLAAFAFFQQSSTVYADSPFAAYPGDIKWEEEVLFLDNLAIYLRKHPEMVGHIVFYSDRKVSRRQLSRRVKRSSKYLYKTRGIDKQRIKIHYGGMAEKSKILHQPLDKKIETPWK